MADNSSVDFAVVAYRDEGVWQVQPLPPGSADDIETLVDALRPWPSDTGALGFVSVDDDFFVIARVMGPSVRLLLSDVTAATEWELASGVIDLLDLPEPDDEDLYPEELLGDVARFVGFEAQFQAAVDAVSV